MLKQKMHRSHRELTAKTQMMLSDNVQLLMLD